MGSVEMTLAKIDLGQPEQAMVVEKTLSGRVIRHCSHRLFEWLMAGAMVGIALTVLISPHSIESDGFHLMQNVGLTRDVLVAFFLIASVLRAAGLYANGHWPVYGPWCRVAGALGGALIWGQMCLSLALWSEQAGYISIDVAVFASLAVGEILSSVRAARDGRPR